LRKGGIRKGNEQKRGKRMSREEEERRETNSSKRVGPDGKEERK
jgi:hypothetical protein